MIETALKDLEKDIALMRAAGHTHLPLRFEMVEALIAITRASTTKRKRPRAAAEPQQQPVTARTA